MKKENTTPGTDTPPADSKSIATVTAAPAGDEVAAIADEGATKGGQLLDPKHDWPTKGGSYVRQADGKLKREN